MTLIRPWRQSTVRGTRMTLADSGTESSSSLQMMTDGQQEEAGRNSGIPIDSLGWPLRAVTWARADWTLGYSESRVMMKMTGRCSSTRARGPCLSSPARI
jgi:hypothetical protein